MIAKLSVLLTGALMLAATTAAAQQVGVTTPSSLSSALRTASPATVTAPNATAKTMFDTPATAPGVNAGSAISCANRPTKVAVENCVLGLKGVATDGTVQ